MPNKIRELKLFKYLKFFSSKKSNFNYILFTCEIILVSKIFFKNFDSKMGVKMNFRIITKKIAAGPEKRFLTKSILK